MQTAGRERNALLAQRLRQCADLLEHQAANPFHVRAYQQAAEVIDGLQEDVGRRIDEQGFEGLTALPGIGPSIAGAIAEMVQTGR